MLDRLDNAEALARHLRALLRRDPRLRDVAKRAGAFTIRRHDPGFAGLLRIVCGQQLSTASANAIWARFVQLPGALAAETYLELSEETVRGIGFSAGKYRTGRAVAEAILSGGVDLVGTESLPADQAVLALTRIKGIGPWTAEIYLMFCAGHPDVFPAGDLALQLAVQWAFGLDARPPAKDLIATAAAWAPHRATAALLLWRYYAAVRKKEGIVL